MTAVPSSCLTARPAPSRRRSRGDGPAAFSDGAAPRSGPCSEEGLVSKGHSVIVLGIVLIVVGLVESSLKILLWVGIVLLVVGLILNFVPIGGRRRRTY